MQAPARCIRPMRWRAAAGALLACLPALLAWALLCAAVPYAAARGEHPPVAQARGAEVALPDLPPEARHTLALIRKGGPFPYDRDGIVFGNREKLLPQRERGWYLEYTVPTPGARNRGARRIVAARSGEFYYTDDHYASFRRIRE
jgi:ribonuclease T1